MDENQYWATVWKLCTAVVVVGIVTLGSCSIYETKRVAEAVQSGVDPITARCGIVGVRGSVDSAMCGVKAAR